MRFNFFRGMSGHCENFYCLSFNEEFDESFADYFLILVGGFHIIQNRFCQLFFVNCKFSVNFSKRFATKSL